jgi:general secretion pathway protein G
MEAFEKALDNYRLNVGQYPTSSQGLDALVNRPSDVPAENWGGPYLKKSVPLDPWHHPYVYRMPGSKSEFEIISYGKAGQPGGTGENAPITFP